MRKKLSVLMVIILTLSILVGCTPNELEFYSLINQISNIEFYEIEGELSIDISGSLIEYMVNEDPIAESSIGFADGLVIKYKGQQALKQKKALISLEYKNKENPEFSHLTTVIFDEDTLYLEIDQIKDLLIDSVRAEDEEVANDLEEALKNIDYISMDQAETGNPYYTDNQAEIVDTYFNILDAITEMFKNFDSKTITKTGNKLTYEINSENILDVVENFLTYIAKNDKEIIKGINKVIDSMPADILPASKEELKDEMVYEDLKTDIDGLLLDIKENRDVIENTILNMIEGSKITYSIKKENNIFQTESNIVLNLNDGYQTLNLKINERTNTKEAKESNFIKTIDEERTMDFEDLMNILDKPQFYYTSIIYVDSQEYLVFDGDVYTDKINVIIKDNSTYLPLRRIGEDLGEEVGWNSETKTPYIKRCDEIIEMKGLLVDNTAYVKLRDFEKLGYYVDWMEDTRGAYISRWYTLEEFLEMK